MLHFMLHFIIFAFMEAIRIIKRTRLENGKEAFVCPHCKEILYIFDDYDCFMNFVYCYHGKKKTRR